jgi:hypothetical protein
MHQENSLARALAGTGTTVDFTGKWKNELGSVAEMTQNAAGALSGTYTSQVSGGGGSTIGDLLGYVDGDLISFVVHWRDFQAITAWVGQLDPKMPVDTLKTLWQMTKQVASGEEWASINAGSDTFVRL